MMPADLQATSRGWRVSIADVTLGWVQATSSGFWQAIDTDGRLRVAHQWNKREAARQLAELVLGEASRFAFTVRDMTGADR